MSAIIDYCMKMLAAKKHKPLYADPDPRWTAPMHFWALEDGSTVSFIKTGSAPARVNLISWDGDTWETWDGSAVTLDIGDVLYVKCQTDAAVWTGSGSNYWHFDCTGSVCVGGQLRSIVEKDNFCDKYRTNNRAFYGLFYQNYALVSAETLRLTQDVVTVASKYHNMFFECINLRRGPDITVRSVGNYTSMCQYMFQNCISLDKAPVIWLQSVTGASALYSFLACSGVRRAPNLLFTHFPGNTCRAMLYMCKSLENIGRLRVRSVGGDNTFTSMYSYCNNIQCEDTPIDIDVDRCYASTFGNMFYVSSIKVAPRMTVRVQADTTARTSIFSGMFNNCVWLRDASMVYITCDTLYANTFTSMFDNCVRLEHIPRIMADVGTVTNAVTSAFQYTFRLCTEVRDMTGLVVRGTFTGTATTMFQGAFTGLYFMEDKLPVIDVELTGSANHAFYGFMSSCLSVKDLSSFHIKAVLGTSMFYQAFATMRALTVPPRLEVTGTLKPLCYYGLWQNCSRLENFPDLPFEGAMQDSACYNMFLGCRSARHININMQATGTHTSCERAMFQDCVNLIDVSGNVFNAATATSNYNYSYYFMFSGCFNLERVPEISMQTSTVNQNFSNCFTNDTCLSYIKTHQKAWTGCGNWVSGVKTAATEMYQPFVGGGGRKRTFICPSDAPQTRSASAIPQNWELETFDEP